MVDPSQQNDPRSLVAQSLWRPAVLQLEHALARLRPGETHNVADESLNGGDTSLPPVRAWIRLTGDAHEKYLVGRGGPTTGSADIFCIVGDQEMEITSPLVLLPGTRLILGNSVVTLPQNLCGVDPFLALRLPAARAGEPVILAGVDTPDGMSAFGEGPFGSYTLFAHIGAGKRSRMEDVAAAITTGNGTIQFLTADGMGAYGAGDVAAHVVLETFCDNAKRLHGIDELQGKFGPNLEHAFRSGRGVGNMGACLAGTEISRDKITSIHSGDARGVLFASGPHGGRVLFATEDQTHENFLINHLRMSPDEARRDPEGHKLRGAQGLGMGEDRSKPCVIDTRAIGSNCWWIGGSDGLWKNVSVAEICKYMDVADTPKSLHSYLSHIALQRMRATGGHDDNITFIIYKHEL